MKKHYWTAVVALTLLFSCGGQPSSSSSTSGSSSSSSSSSSSIAIKPVITLSKDSTVKEGEDGSLTLEKDGFSLSVKGGSKSSDWFSVAQGGYITNLNYAGNIIAVEAEVSSSSPFYSLEARTSFYPISSPGNATYPLVSATKLSFESGGPYFSIYSAIGSFAFSSISIYFNDEKPANPTSKIEFYTMNDNHGAAERTSSQIGIARLSSYLKEKERLNGDGVVVLSSGDLWQGSADSNLSYGGVMVDWTNLIGLESMAIGNHEFDWGVEKIEKNAALSNAPFLSINTRNKDGSYPSWCSPSKVIERQGIKIGIVGAIGKLETSIAASSLNGIYFESNYLSMANAEAIRLKNEEGCSLVVLSLHNGAAETSYCPDIDAIFLGHVHSRSFTVEDNIPLVRTASDSKDVGHITFELGEDGKYHYGSYDYMNYSDSSAYSDDEETVRMYNYYLEAIGPIKNRVLGHSSSSYSEERIGLLSCKAGREYYKTKFNPTNFLGYSTNKKGVRQSIPAGDITYGQVYAAFPFDNYNDLCEVKGSVVSLLTGEGYYYDFGDASLTDIDDNVTYTVMTNSYVSEGSLAGFITRINRDDLFIRDIVASYLEANL